MSLNSSATNSSRNHYCIVVGSQTAIAISFTRTVLITPISAFVLYLGHQRWRQQHSRKTISHSDMFAYHLAAIELLWIACFFCFLSSFYAKLHWIANVGYCFSAIILFGEAFFHILTCLERYLAVVHPVRYIGLKNGRIRNISIGCAWLLSVGMLILTFPYQPYFPVIPIISFTSCSLVVVSFCNIRVLFTLVKPKPGDGGREMARVEQSKLRAFHTITAIMGVLCLWYVGYIVTVALATSGLLSEDVSCVLTSTASSYNLPSSLVLPLLFLQRAGKLPFCNYSNTRQ